MATGVTGLGIWENWVGSHGAALFEHCHQTSHNNWTTVQHSCQCLEHRSPSSVTHPQSLHVVHCVKTVHGALLETVLQKC